MFLFGAHRRTHRRALYTALLPYKIMQYIVYTIHAYFAIGKFALPLKQQCKQQSADDAADGADGKGDDIPPAHAVATATRGIAVDDPLCLAHDLLLSAIFGLSTEQKIRLVKDLRVGSFEQYDLSLTATQKLNSVSFKNRENYLAFTQIFLPLLPRIYSFGGENRGKWGETPSLSEKLGVTFLREFTIMLV